MDFDLDDEQRALRDEARRFLEAEAPIAYARSVMDGGPLDAKMASRVAELGWNAIPFPEEHGGLDMGFIPLALLAIEMGRVVYPGPYASTMIGGIAIAESGGDEQRARLLPGIARGATTATLARDGHVVAHGDRLSGIRRFVLDGADAEVVVVVAQLEDGMPALFLAEPTARAPLTTIDGTRALADLTFDDAPAERLEHAGSNVLRRVEDRACVLLAAEMLGCAERALELSTEYAKQREQFGRPIGSFQAVKHRLADMLVDVESLRNAVSYAAWAIEREHPDAGLAAATAKATASDATRRVTAGAIQVHGGIGFTWEHDAHLFFKRVKLAANAFGDATFHRERIARLIAARAGR
ncbi:MAG TPA: acyl-CoA dehydrogenase family protein [Actinomycetota bacterium]